MHKGIDIAAPRGTYIALRVDCEVMGTAFQAGGYGNVIDVWVPQYGVQLRFGHCDKIIQGSGNIPAGKSFATVGSTGRSDGPHIHFEYTKSKNSRTKSDGDPSPYVPLILLTSGTSSAGDFVSSAKPSAAQIAVTNNKQVAQRITTERQGEEVVVIRLTIAPGVKIPVFFHTHCFPEWNNEMYNYRLTKWRASQTENKVKPKLGRPRKYNNYLK